LSKGTPKVQILNKYCKVLQNIIIFAKTKIAPKKELFIEILIIFYWYSL
jgi:hypothetical protein